MVPHPRLIFSLAYNPYAAVGRSSYASNATLTPSQHALQCLSDMPPTLLTILTLVECLPDMPPTLLTILTLPVTSRHASNAAYNP
ncbi:hypothetical protein O181_096235 [Austropuccinia psidii MF-1]|uniref:Uncharacterized protein n=1 Tax=Austropuccinia psidii MF-1 TaxID=1389203 RepID=A0A9Q3PCT7_9BASI|nr:hypothetical protein [Austropuccinia psidii MF-1]